MEILSRRTLSYGRRQSPQGRNRSVGRKSWWQRLKNPRQAGSIEEAGEPTKFIVMPGVGMRLASSESGRLEFDEHVLVSQAQKGDRQAFAALVEQYWDGLYRWLYHVTHHRQTAEDLAQEAFLKAMAGLGSFRAGRNFRAWLFRIAYNSFLNHRRGESPARAR